MGYANGSRNVLIVDDEPFNLLKMSDLVSRLGYNPLTATNGVDACVVASNNDLGHAILDNNFPEIGGIPEHNKGLELAYKLNKMIQFGRMPLEYIALWTSMDKNGLPSEFNDYENNGLLYIPKKIINLAPFDIVKSFLER